MSVSVPFCSSFLDRNDSIDYPATLANYLFDYGHGCRNCDSTHIEWGGSLTKVCIKHPTIFDSADKNLGVFVVSNT